jgi:hypothetical protein
MIDACEHYRRRDAGVPPDSREELPVRNEDAFFAVALTKLGYRIAPRTIAAQFAAEMVPPTYLDSGVTGLHKPYGYLSAAVVARLVAGTHLSREKAESDRQLRARRRLEKEVVDAAAVPQKVATLDPPAPEPAEETVPPEPEPALPAALESSPPKTPRYDSPQVNDGDMVLTRSGSRAEIEMPLLPGAQGEADGGPARKRRPRAISQSIQQVVVSSAPAVWSAVLFCGAIVSVGLAVALWSVWGYLFHLGDRVETFMSQAEPLLQAVICLVQHPQPPACAHILRLFYVGNTSDPG